MTPDYRALKAEDATPAYSGMADPDRVGAMNAPTSPVPGIIAPGYLLTWAASTGSLAKIEAGRSDPAIGSICLAVGYLLSGGSLGLDCTSAANLQLLGALVAANICTQAQSAQLIALGASPGPSIAAGLGFPAGVTAADLAHARSLA